ncbi:MAG: 16S rRNA (adenine(1518)-N(6)/adenine(1519)-N(6))-dimethyltransferase RsmA [Cyclobacteriaceae bacterium]
MVRPKKFLGQHFLTDQRIAQRIVDALQLEGQKAVLEIGPGTGVLTQYLLKKELNLKVAEIDRDSVAHLKEHFPQLSNKIIEGDILDYDWNGLFDENFNVIGNFPYNISSQIFFKVLDHRQQVDQVVCMLQKEVADRIASPKGNKVYGILSVLLQAYYDVEMLFKVPPGVFFPPPKVMSAVIRLKRNETRSLDCDETMFVTIVKQGFQNRRKTLRNALKRLNLPASIVSLPLLDLRAEQLGVNDFVFLTQQIQKSNG